MDIRMNFPLIFKFLQSNHFFIAEVNINNKKGMSHSFKIITKMRNNFDRKLKIIHRTAIFLPSHPCFCFLYFNAIMLKKKIREF